MSLFAGAAKRKITPSPDLLKRLGEDGRGFEGVHADIYVRAIVLSDGKQRVLLASSDLGKFPAQQTMCDRLAKEYGIEPLGCVLGCTHNHEAPHSGLSIGDDEGMRPPRPVSAASEEYTLFIHDMLAEAVAEAVDKLQPARLGVNKGTSYINACRDLPTPVGGIQANNFHGPSDHELIVIKVESLTGETIAVLVNHATHSNYMVWNVTDRTYPMINDDVGGGISRFVEKANKDQFPVLWVIGAAGDQNPITRSRLRSVEIDEEGNFVLKDNLLSYRENLLQLQNLCATQGLEVIDLLNTMDNFTEEFNFKGAELYREIPSRKSYNSLKIQPLCGERPEPVPGDKPVKFRFRLFEVCGIAFAGVNCEAYTNLGLLIKNLIPRDTTMIYELAFGGVGYIMDKDTEWINGFGTMGSSARSGEDVNKAFEEGFTELKNTLGM